MGVLVSTLLVLLLIGVPIAFVLGVSGAVALLVNGFDLSTLAVNMVSGPDNFVLLAIPLFMIAGEIMNRCGMTESLVKFAVVVIGWVRGGLAHANILASLIFAGLTGAAVADVAALGSIFIPAMEKEGYDRKFSAAVTACSSVVGPIIPPSIIIVIYGAIVGVSIGGLFAAALIPGLLIGVSDMLIVYWIAKKRNYPKREHRLKRSDYVNSFKAAFFAIVSPVIIIGGIMSGVFTPTEAAAVAVLYSLIVGMVIYRTMSFKDLPKVFYDSAVRSSIVLLIIATSITIGWMFSILGVPRTLSNFLLQFTHDRTLGVAIVILFILFIGTFMETGAACILFAPIIAPVMHNLGLHPIHFGLIMVVALNIGLVTPPMGVCLFTVQSIAAVPLGDLVKDCLPFILVNVVVLFIIALFPELVMILPQMFGFA